MSFLKRVEAKYGNLWGIKFNALLDKFQGVCYNVSINYERN